MQSGKISNVPELTGIRALAALLVFLHHFLSPPTSDPAVYSQSIFAHFHIGVSFFFVLSGFLIHYNYFEILSSGKQGWRKFLFHRIARIMPLYLFLSVLTFPVFCFTDHESVVNCISFFLLNISLLKGFVPSALFSGIPQGWSLTVEFCFYLMVPFLFYAFRNKFSYYVLIVICLFSFGFLLEGCFFRPALNTQMPFFFTYTFAGRSFEFFAGCFLASIWNKRQKSKSNFPWYTLTGIAGISLALIGLTVPLISNIQLLNGIILNLLLPVLILIFYKGLLTENTILRIFFSLESVQLLGKISFAFYLIHVGVIERFLAAFISDNVVILFVLLNGIAWILYRFIELPARQWLLKRYSVKN